MIKVINKIFQFFNTECPESFTHYSPRLTSLGIFTMIFVSLYIFKPFKLYILENEIMISLILGYTIIPSVVFLITYAFVNPSNKSYQWTIFKDIVWVMVIFLLSGALVYSYTYIVFNFLYTEHGGEYFLPFYGSILYCIIIGFIIYVFFKLLDWIFYLKNVAIDDKSKNIQFSISDIAENNKKIVKQQSIPVITLTGKNINEEIIVAVNNILCVKAIGNYLSVFLVTKDNIIKKRTIRNSLGNIWEILNQFDLFYQCHRSYIINKNELVGIKGTSKKMTARIRNLEEPIPVARKNIKEVKEMFNKFV